MYGIVWQRPKAWFGLKSAVGKYTLERNRDSGGK